jgi:hypothetical protein
MRSAYFAGMPTIMKFIQWLMLGWTLTLRRWAYSIGTKTLIEPGNNKITQRIFHRGRLVDEKTWKVW